MIRTGPRRALSSWHVRSPAGPRIRPHAQGTLSSRYYGSSTSDGPKEPPSSVSSNSAALCKHIRDIIVATGPMTLAKYMQLSLTSPVGGYYTRGQAIGGDGDFVTSPEISQMFGEIMAVWYVMHWQMLGSPADTVFVELGPGRGTLVDDVLRVARRFPRFFASIRAVHLVERSPELRRIQRDRLCGPTETGAGAGSVGAADAPVEAVSRHAGIPVRWHDLLEEIDMAAAPAPMVMAHEFFDALPIHRFEKRHDGHWSEILVDVAPKNSNNNSSSTALAGSASSTAFRFVKSRSVTASAAMLLRDSAYASRFSRGDHIEVCPEAARIMAQLAAWITSRRGMALVVDYGQDWTQGDTFRGVRAHSFANPLDAPGSMDLTADVDFSYLRHAAKDTARCFGPIEQGAFLHAMGIQSRLDQLLRAVGDDKPLQTDLVDRYKRLTDPYSMGRIYKAMAVFPAGVDDTPIPFAPPSKDSLNRPNVEKTTSSGR
ncbi:hypothetical protein GGI11_003237 [Coemansia sp. RSA 2049]|nr:hypothetical protein GGI11_003237 [Coemansia sp. RSA 2049]